MLQSLPLDTSDVDPLQGSEGGEEVAVVHPRRAGDDEVRLRDQRGRVQTGG